MTSLSVTDILTHLVVTFLTPMFLATTGCNVEHARAAALATVQACTIRNPLDLLLVGQMIALSLATISSVSQSMADDLSVNQVLRLRGNANSLHRASERCRTALPEPDTATQDPPLTEAELAHEEAVLAEVRRVTQRVADHKAAFTQRESPPRQSAPAQSAPIQSATPSPADPDFPPRFPESFDTMKAAMAHIIAESDRRTGESAPNRSASTTAPPRG